MRFCRIVPVVATVLSCVSLLPAATLAFRPYGVCVGPYTGNQSPQTVAFLPETQLRGRLQPLVGTAEWVRFYGCTHGLEQAGRVAHSLGFKTAVAAWLGPETNSAQIAANHAEIASVIAAAHLGHADVVIVGSEVLLRHDLSESQLLAYINQVKASVPPGIPVTCAEEYTALLGSPAVMEAVDLVMVHLHPFWYGKRIDEAMSWLAESYDATMLAANGKAVVIGETGWPTAGEAFGFAEPGAANAAYFFLAFNSWVRSRNISSFYFAPYDEAFKISEGSQGPHWGLRSAAGGMKPWMNLVYQNKILPEEAVLRVAKAQPAVNGSPEIVFSYIPPYGSRTNKVLYGFVTGLAPSSFSYCKIATYIEVNGGFWTKPTYASPTVALAADGTFAVNVVTGGVDQTATTMEAFLLPKAAVATLAHGEPEVPPDVVQNSLASLTAQRPAGFTGGGSQLPGHTVAKLAITRSFSPAKTAVDTAAVSGLLTLPEGFVTADKTVTVRVGGLQWNFSPLTAAGNAVAADASAAKAVGTFALRRNAVKRLWAWSASVHRAAGDPAWEGYGLMNASLGGGGIPVFVDVVLSIDGEERVSVCPMYYTATAGRSGVAK